MNPPSIIDTLWHFFERNSLTEACGVIAVSGGPDSVALAVALASLHRQGKFPKLVMAHVNHQLRGRNSDADESFVLDLGNRLGICCRSQTVDVATLAETGGANLEDFSRQVRYDWFTKVACEVGAAWVATGHTADDQAETILFRLLRGAGLHGLSGMRPRRPLGPGVELVRPLLSCRRSDVLTFLNANQQDFRQDASNLDRGFTRNRLRLELMPDLIAKYNLDLIPSLCHLAEQAREAQEVVEESARKLLADVELPRAGSTIVLQAALLDAAPRHLQRELFRLVWVREGWPQSDMTFEHWDCLPDIVAGTPPVQDFPKGIIARRTHGVVQLGRSLTNGA